MTDEMERYYAERAAEYDRVYAHPAWARDLPRIGDRIEALFAGRRVFEVACGTGYWTERVARVAARVHAEDLNAEPLALARRRRYSPASVTLARHDAYVPGIGGFDGGLAALWLSHVDLARMDEFLAAFHSRLERGAPVLMFDERDTPDRQASASRVDAAGNRYERRRIAGAEFEIVKNFFDGDGLARRLASHGRDFRFEELERFWLLTYRSR